MTLTVEDIVQVKIGGMKQPINLKADLFWKSPSENRVTSMFFVKLVKYKSEICRLLGQPMLQCGPGKRQLQ